MRSPFVGNAVAGAIAAILILLFLIWFVPLVS